MTAPSGLSQGTGVTQLVGVVAYAGDAPTPPAPPGPSGELRATQAGVLRVTMALDQRVLMPR